MAKKVLSDIERFMKFVSVSQNGCWEWLGAINIWGYGQFHISYSKGQKKQIRAHRFSYEHFKTKLGSFHIDHLCKNKKCVHPEHLEAVTQQENSRRARKEKCKRGHIVAENPYQLKRGPIICRICKNATSYAYEYRKRGKNMFAEDVISQKRGSKGVTH